MCTRILTAAVAAALAAGWCMAAGAAKAPPADFHVATDGRDDNPGTADRPFATPARARDAVRKKIAAGLKANVTVLIRGGRYRLESPLVFGPEDSGTEAHSVTYAAEGGAWAVLSGGRDITGWKEGKGGLWTVHLPKVQAGKWHFRQLFVGGWRRTRARTPNARMHGAYCYRLVDASLSKDLKRHTLTLPPGVVKQWANLADVEAVVLKNWANLRKRIESVDPAAGLVVLQPPHVKYFGGNRPRKGRACFLENARELLDEPGEWYLDRRTGVLTYWARQRDQMKATTKIAPVLRRLLEIAGRPDAPVRNLHFRGLRLLHSDLPLPPEGHHGRQAAFRYGADAITGGMPAAVRWTHAVGCSLVGGQVAHVGGSAIELREGCHHNRIEGNEVFDVEGNGIGLGGPNDPQLAPRGNRIANNYVHNCGQIYYGACAIWAGFAQKTLIEHNLVTSHPYTGISIGWCWDDRPTAAREYAVAYNRVAGVMNQVSDGGAIYTLGYQPGTVIRGNVLRGVGCSPFADASQNNGIFLDQGSKGFLIEGNVVSDTAGAPVRHHRNSPKDHTWRNNLFSNAEVLAKLTKGKVGKGLECGHIDVPHSPALEPEHLTVSAWIETDYYPERWGRQRGWVVGKNADERTDGHYGLIVTGRNVGAYLTVGGAGRGQSLVQSTDGPLKSKTWHHLAMTYDGKDLKLYADGKRIGGRTIGRPRRPGNGPLTIGRRPDGRGGTSFRGVIDEVRIYSRALPDEQVQALHRAPEAARKGDPGASGLVGYWDFETLEGREKALETYLGMVRKAGLEPKWAKVLLPPPRVSR